MIVIDGIGSHRSQPPSDFGVSHVKSETFTNGEENRIRALAAILEIPARPEEGVS
jgi:hypothetical protein